MHNSTNPDIIKQELEEKGHIVLKITNIRHRFNKNPLPMFFVDLKPAENNKTIFKIEFLLNTKIAFEPPIKKREIPQCTRCQLYGHTKNFCFRQPRCVKCTGNHATSECPIKTKSNSVKCVHCNGNHPANYRGCSVYKELQRQKFPALRKKEVPTSTIPVTQQFTSRKSYAQVVKSINSNTPEEALPQVPTANHDDMSELKQMMKTIMEQMGSMLNLLTTLISKLSNA